MIKRSTLQVRLLLFFGILILVNIVSSRFFVRLDFTGDKRYSLSNATKDILKTLDGPVTISAYFSKQLPPNIQETRNDFKDLLVEYVNVSHGKIVYEFINPSENDESEKKAQQAGVSPVMVNVRERDQVKQQRAYLGAVITYNDRKEVIPFIQPGAAMEYAISSSIKKLLVADKPRIAMIEGHGEQPISAMQQEMGLLSVLYSVDPLKISDTADIAPLYKTIAIVSPKDSFPAAQLAMLDRFLARGGGLYIAMNRVEGDFSTQTGHAVNTGLEQWLKEKGVDVQDKFVIDANCGQVNVQQQQGMFSFSTPVRFPYLPLVNSFADHPITKGLEGIMFPFVSPVQAAFRDTSVKVTVLARSSQKSGLLGPNLTFEISKQWTANDFPHASLPLAIAASGKIFGDVPSRMVVIGDGDFAINGERQQGKQLQPDNVSLMVNAIDWLSDNTGLNELRTKGVTSRPLNSSLEDGTKTMLKYFNFLFPVILILLYGFVRMQMRSRLRARWIEETY